MVSQVSLDLPQPTTVSHTLMAWFLPLIKPATSKHAVLGLLRSLHENLYPNLPVRINAIGPSWTETGIVPKAIIAALGQDAIQSPDVVARSVVNLMANNHHGEFIYSDRGKFWDIESGENALHSWGGRHLPSYVSEQGAIEKLKKLAKGITQNKGEEQEKTETKN